MKNPKLRKPEIFGKLAEVACCRNLRRGRQSFIIAMGYTSARQYAAGLVPMLSDVDVDGQVLHTLLKMKAPGFASDVRPLQKSDKTWIRRLANKYLDRFPL
ncbi:MAG: hypothetical protein ROO76_13390 [Terriglobia bacterium]|nr:hypothetical protein [Terriglobia bacterium]